MIRSLTASPRGFTLFELMIVMSMIAILFSTAIFPYQYYMDRARVEHTIDTISQEWIMAHQDIRGWLLHEGTGSHAHMYLDMHIGDSALTFMTSTGWTGEKKEYKKYNFDTNIVILGFTGSIASPTSDLSYHISPPYAQGAFSNNGSPEAYLSGVILTVGYSWATRESRRARDILLRPYFD